MESGSRISYTRTLEEQTLVYLSVSPPNLSMMLVWINLADPHLSVFSDFAHFSQTLTLKPIVKIGSCGQCIPRKNIKQALSSYWRCKIVTCNETVLGSFSWGDENRTVAHHGCVHI